LLTDDTSSKRLSDEGFEFQFPNLDDALADLLDSRRFTPRSSGSRGSVN
jgi:NAD dependent epimerase/dehydratase family enzyme